MSKTVKNSYNIPYHIRAIGSLYPIMNIQNNLATGSIGWDIIYKELKVGEQIANDYNTVHTFLVHLGCGWFKEIGVFEISNENQRPITKVVNMFPDSPTRA